MRVAHGFNPAAAVVRGDCIRYDSGMNSMFTLHHAAHRIAMHPAPGLPAPRSVEFARLIALERWENEGGKILPSRLPQDSRALFRQPLRASANMNTMPDRGIRI